MPGHAWASAALLIPITHHAAQQRTRSKVAEVRDVHLDQEQEQAVGERARAALLGAFVADAATMGLHWCAASTHA